MTSFYIPYNNKDVTTLKKRVY